MNTFTSLSNTTFAPPIAQVLLYIYMCVYNKNDLCVRQRPLRISRYSFRTNILTHILERSHRRNVRPSVHLSIRVCVAPVGKFEYAYGSMNNEKKSI